jgi:adenylate kinase
MNSLTSSIESPNVLTADVALLGMPGAGKDTVAKKIVSELGYKQFSASGALRAKGSQNPSFQAELDKYMPRGLLVPDELVLPATKDAILAKASEERVLFNGMPRTLDQMLALDEVSQEVGRVLFAIYLVLDKEEAIRRMMIRAEIEKRIDDTPETIAVRLGIFDRENDPIIHAYEADDRLQRVDAEGTPEEVKERVFAAIRGMNDRHRSVMDI